MNYTIAIKIGLIENSRVRMIVAIRRAEESAPEIKREMERNNRLHYLTQAAHNANLEVCSYLFSRYLGERPYQLVEREMPHHMYRHAFQAIELEFRRPESDELELGVLWTEL